VARNAILSPSSLFGISRPLASALSFPLLSSLQPSLLRVFPALRNEPLTTPSLLLLREVLLVLLVRPLIVVEELIVCRACLGRV
jgi:hypothetical protein